MRQFTLEDLKRIVREGAGAEAGAFDGDVLDVSFTDLGYDSLAMFETVSRVSREFDVPLADAATSGGLTPRTMVRMVNQALHATAD